MLKGVNWIAVAVSLVVLQVAGYLWYSVIFHAPWMAALGPNPRANLAMGPALGAGALNTLIVMIGLAWLLKRLGAATLAATVGAALAAWFFFDLTTMAIDYIFVGQSLALVEINAGFQLVSYGVAGVIFGLLPAKTGA